MFKRANKITSLLVAASAIISIVPAYASDVKKIESQDGTVYNAVAYKDGEFYIDGEVNDKDEASYYLANGNYNDLSSDITAGSDVSAYGTKYVEVQGGDYYVDLSTGKTTSDSIASNARDDAASNLRKKVKADTDGRYMKDGLAGAADYLQTFDATSEISGSKFGDVWYTAKLTNKDATNGYTANTAAGAGTADLNVFTDGNGNYIDADYNLGKIKVTTTSSAATKSAYVENTNDTYDAATSGTVSASLRQDKVIGQDKDYIYRTATVTITTTSSAATLSQIDGKDITCSAFHPSADRKTVSFDVIQKISKAQSSSDIAGAKYAKNVTAYLICDSDAKTETFSYDNYTFANGKVIGYNTDKTTTSDNVKVQTGTLKSSDGLYYIDLASSSTEDTEVYDSNTVAVQTDVNGNLWRLNGGYIYQWNNDKDWDKVYKVDGSFNQFSVYDKDNIVAWNQSDAVYSVIGGKTTKETPKDTTTDTTKDSTTDTTTNTNTNTNTNTTATTPVVAKGWVKAADGNWVYNKADGTKATGWLQDGATWYYLNANGAMQTGWANVSGTWYYLNASGAMQTGWINDNGTWYYCNASGAMLANTVVDGYVLGANGTWIR